MGCADCDLVEVMPDGSLFCAVLDTGVHSDTVCDFWCNDLLVNVPKEEYAPSKEDQYD